LVYTATVPRISAVRILGVLAGACLIGGVNGCATGTPMQHDAAPPQQDANEPPTDGGLQLDAQKDGPLQSDAPVQLDGPLDAPVQQDAQHDTFIQQDAQHDVYVQSDVGQCSQNADCFPDSGAPTDGPGLYCYTAKAKCYEPGTCSDDSECKAGETCRLVLGTCSCPTLLLPCRPHETCILFPGFGNFCTAD
jgi:hypothetical protein